MQKKELKKLYAEKTLEELKRIISTFAPYLQPEGQRNKEELVSFLAEADSVGLVEHSMQLESQNEVDDVYVCSVCNASHRVPKNSDVPVCPSKQAENTMKPVYIFYAENPHPTENKEWGDVYRKVHFVTEQDKIALPISYRRKYWKKLPVDEEIDGNLPIESQLETLYLKYNNNNFNPLSSENDPGQTKLKEAGIRHTSMSVGDILRVECQDYIVSGRGFKKIEWYAKPVINPEAEL